MPGSNRWNRFIYSLWAPIYDLLVNAPPLRRAREAAIKSLALRGNEQIALIGVGTGVDLSLLPDGVVARGLDLSPAMLARAARKLPIPGREVTLLQGDAEHLPFSDQCVDASILTLILSVVPHPDMALQEAVRITKVGGRLVVFDKFLPTGARPSLTRRLLAALIRPFGTDIARSFESMHAGLPIEVESDQPALLGGHYRTILLRRIADSRDV